MMGRYTCRAVPHHYDERVQRAYAALGEGAEEGAALGNGPRLWRPLQPAGRRRTAEGATIVPGCCPGGARGLTHHRVAAVVVAVMAVVVVIGAVVALRL